LQAFSLPAVNITDGTTFAETALGYEEFKRRGAWTKAALALFGLIGLTCSAPGSAEETTSTPAADQWVKRSTRSFKRALFYKPRENGANGPEWTYAPLIVQEVDDGWEADLTEPFGAITQKGTIDQERPTVYVATSTARLGGREHDQVTYAWRYPERTPRESCLKDAGMRGVRLTLSADGMPLVWEALSTEEPRRVLFVSNSLEEAAKREFGDPLPRRTFSVEREVAEARDVVVVRVIDDGPVPMGPYVYLSALPRRDITTVLCRCSPSQVDEFVATRSYELLPLETTPKGLTRWQDFARADYQPSLERDLRWPTQAP
jgi:hypothetical protein